MDWIENEYGSVSIGDQRLNKRAKHLLKRFSDKPMESIPESCKGWPETKAAYRFFGNNLVTAKKIIKPHRISTLNRIKEYGQEQIKQDNFRCVKYANQSILLEASGPRKQSAVYNVLAPAT